MRQKRTLQRGLDFSKSHLKITNEYYAKYERVSNALDEAPELLTPIHRDLEESLESVNRDRRGRRPEFTTDNVLRVLLAQAVEGASLREIVVRIDDSNFLRRFTRIDNSPMMDFTTLCKFKNAIRPETWKTVNDLLARSAVQRELISGDRVRLDTTAVETDIHWPTDSTLLWDVYRTFDRLLQRARHLDREAVGSSRLQTRRAKRLHLKINRKAAKKNRSAKHLALLESLYSELIGMVEKLLLWAQSVREALSEGRLSLDVMDAIKVQAVIGEIDHFVPLGNQVVEQARRRVLRHENVPNSDKIFSIFEPHTELLIRGKAGKNIEFGHMIQLQQVEGKFITDYEVFDRRPVEHTLLDPALRSHKKLFGHYPDELSADKGYYESMKALEQLQRKVPVVSIAKKGRRTTVEVEREHSSLFRLAQAFRAGVEGTISFLKRALRLARCFNKGWEHFVSTVGQTILAHNLLVLARH